MDDDINHRALIDALQHHEDLKMNEQVIEKKDNFWLYVIVIASLLIMVAVLLKINESQKFAQIKQWQNEEQTEMNIRILRDYEK